MKVFQTPMRDIDGKIDYLEVGFRIVIVFCVCALGYKTVEAATTLSHVATLLMDVSINESNSTTTTVITGGRILRLTSIPTTPMTCPTPTLPVIILPKCPEITTTTLTEAVIIRPSTTTTQFVWNDSGYRGTVPESYKKCNPNTDTCVLINQTCCTSNMGGKITAINIYYEKKYFYENLEGCSKIGIQCSGRTTDPPNGWYAACVEGRCERLRRGGVYNISAWF